MIQYADSTVSENGLSKQILGKAVKNERKQLCNIIEKLIRPDLKLYLAEPSPHSAGWAVMEHPLGLFLISYESVFGVHLSFLTKPCHACGTGWACMENGFRFIDPEKLDDLAACGRGHYESAKIRGEHIPSYKNAEEYMARTGVTFHLVKGSGPEPKLICPKCGSTEKFYAHQRLYADIIVNSNGDFASNLDCGLEAAVYNSDPPYGPYTCCGCGCEFDPEE